MIDDGHQCLIYATWSATVIFGLEKAYSWLLENLSNLACSRQLSSLILDTQKRSLS